METQNKILRKFITERFEVQGIKPNAQSISAIYKVVSLEKGIPPEEGETRKVTVIEDTDGEISAKSISLYNLLKVSFQDLRGFLLKETTILFTEDEKVKIVFSLLNLIHEFMPKLAYSFNKQDSKLLLSIFNINLDSFSGSVVADQYRLLYNESITDEQLFRSINFFVAMKILRNLGNDTYELRQKMEYERN